MKYEPGTRAQLLTLRLSDFVFGLIRKTIILDKIRKRINSSDFKQKILLVIWLSMAVIVSPTEGMKKNLMFYGRITFVSYHKSNYKVKK